MSENSRRAALEVQVGHVHEKSDFAAITEEF